MLYRTQLLLTCSWQRRGVDFSLAAEVVEILMVDGDRFSLSVLPAELEFPSLLPLGLLVILPEHRNLIGALVGLGLLLVHLVEQRERRLACGAFAWQWNCTRDAAIGMPVNKRTCQVLQACLKSDLPGASLLSIQPMRRTVPEDCHLLKSLSVPLSSCKETLSSSPPWFPTLSGGVIASFASTCLA